MASPRYSLLNGWVKHARLVVSYFRERGVRNGMSTLLQLKSLKQGELKGVDRFGNQYYESAVEVPGRHRWVVYPSKKAVDGSAVPPEWHGWLHHIGDETPNERPFAVPAYQREHQRNVMSRAGAEADYLPSGHLLAAKPSHFLRTGADAEGTPDGAYAAWHSGNQSNPNPNEQFKYAPKVERR